VTSHSPTRASSPTGTVASAVAVGEVVAEAAVVAGDEVAVVMGALAAVV
jgi:hypothetical protein